MKTYPGLPVPRVEVVLDYDASRERYDGKAEFLIASLHLCGNTGAYVDSPRHRFRGGVDLAGLSLDRLAHVPAMVIDATAASGRGIGAEWFRGVDVRGKAVLVRTEWSLLAHQPLLRAESTLDCGGLRVTRRAGSGDSGH